MNEIDVYLSDEFVEFSKQIADIHAKKKAKQEELKHLFESAKAQIKAFDDQASKLKADWDVFVAKNKK